MAPPNPELLVASGLLPENLPPVFQADELTLFMSIFYGFRQVKRTEVGTPCVYNSSKRGGQRRIFSVPHPKFIFEQAYFINKHWDHIESRFQKAPGSASIPTFDETADRYVHITPHAELPKLRLSKLSRFRFCLVADVSRFYYSIYTHALPWALHGKKNAKKERKENSETIFGNWLDFVIRQAQSQQTVGIPVGPDTSRIIAEILMCAVDERFVELSASRKLTYVRHVDDYWVGGDTYEECEKHLRNLRLALKDFELDINEAKTRIISTKYIFSDTWPSEFKKELVETLGNESPGSALEAVSTFGKIIEYATNNNDDGIIRNTIRIIDTFRFWLTHWDILEHFLAQCAVQFPHSFDYVAKVIAWRIRNSEPIDRTMWIEIAVSTAMQAGSLGHDSEVMWALWLLRNLEHPISKELSDLLMSYSSGLVLGFLAHFPSHNLADDKKLLVALAKTIEEDPFSGSKWPLALELCHLNAEPAHWFRNDSSDLRLMCYFRLSMIDWDGHTKSRGKGRAIESGGGYDGDEEADNEDEIGLDDLL